MDSEKKLGRKPIPPEKHRKAQALSAEGLDAKQISKKLKISLPKVYEFLRYPAPEEA